MKLTTRQLSKHDDIQAIITLLHHMPGPYVAELRAAISRRLNGYPEFVEFRVVMPPVEGSVGRERKQKS